MSEAHDIAFLDDITLRPPPRFTKERADAVYGDAFRRAMEFITCQPMPDPVGDVLEFGTLNGYTARKLAELMRELGHLGKLYLFDSFEGMPEAAHPIDLASYEIRQGAWRAGTPRLRVSGAEVNIGFWLSDILTTERVMIVPGWFNETLKRWFPHLMPPSIVHIDCDLFESTATVLDALQEHGLYRQGTVFLFDDWNCGRGSNAFGERRAVIESPFWHERLEPWFSYGWGGQSFIFQEMV